MHFFPLRYVQQLLQRTVLQMYRRSFLNLRLQAKADCNRFKIWENLINLPFLDPDCSLKSGNIQTLAPDYHYSFSQVCQVSLKNVWKKCLQQSKSIQNIRKEKAPVQCVLASSLQAKLCSPQHTPGNTIASIIQTSKWTLQIKNNIKINASEKFVL